MDFYDAITQLRERDNDALRPDFASNHNNSMTNRKLPTRAAHLAAVTIVTMLSAIGNAQAQTGDTRDYSRDRQQTDLFHYDTSSGQTGPGASGQPMSDGIDSNGNYRDNTLSGMNDALQSGNRRTPQASERDPWSLGSAQYKSAPTKLSRFQQFVYESSGRVLPIYGKKLFDPPQVAYVPNTAGPVADNYVLGPGDQVQVRVWGSVNYEGNLTLDRNGQVNIPRAGVVALGGVRVKDVENAIRAQIGKTFTNFNLNSTPGALNGIQIYVVGQAEQPGSYTVSSSSTLVNALFISGGPRADGSLRNIQLRRAGKIVASLDLYDFIHDGVSSQDPQLLAGDVIVIPPAGPQVAVTGALDNAAVYELKSDGATTLGELLALGGGIPTLAKTQKALLERVANEKTAPREVHDLALDDDGLGTSLRDGDIVTLLNISPQFANAVTLQGNVAAPARYRWFEGMRIRDLIPERDALITPDYYRRKNSLVQEIDDTSLSSDSSSAVAQHSSSSLRSGEAHPGSGVDSEYAQAAGTETRPNGSVDPKKAGRSLSRRVRNMVDQINWDYAVVERLDTDHLRTRLIPFNLGKAVLDNDETQNLPLEPGDVVTILNQNDLQLPEGKRTRLVRIEGEVAAPGIYEALPGETLQQLIERVGGLTPQAYLFGTEVDRESVREKQQQNLDMLIRSMEQQQQSQILFMLANRDSSNDVAGQAALIQQQQQLARTQLESLKRMRSNGRIALELDPRLSEISALPALTLEDGDHVLIPPTPGFVSVVGAVNNENVFIYKSDRTVGEIAKVAGLREEADIDQMFILRADGSIISTRERSGLFQSFGRIKLMPGDTLVVPEKLDRETTRNFVARQLKDWTQILSQFGLGVAAIKVIRDL